jgi:hypothetical protein
VAIGQPQFQSKILFKTVPASETKPFFIRMAFWRGTGKQVFENIVREVYALASRI